MKIIGKHKDYYDSALGLGHDDACVYVRHQSLTNTNVSVDILPWKNHTSNHTHYFAEHNQRTVSVMDSTLPKFTAQRQAAHFYESFVCVAGKAYSVFVRQKTFSTPSDCSAQGHSESTKVVSLFDQELLNNGEPRYISVDNLLRFSDTARLSYEHTRQNFLDKDFTDLHLELEAPVLLLLNPRFFRSHKIKSSDNIFVVKNPTLKDLRMQNVLDPFSCFQNIEQFISGVVPGQHMPMVTLSDKHMVVKKGFDPKYGFRTRPE